MYQPNDEIRGKYLTAMDTQLRADVQRLTQRQKRDTQSPPKHKRNKSLKNIAVLVVLKK